MTDDYKIIGMSCLACWKKVQDALNAVPGITAEVSLDPPRAVLRADSEVPVSELQRALALAGGYRIETLSELANDSADEKERKSSFSSSLTFRNAAHCDVGRAWVRHLLLSHAL